MVKIAKRKSDGVLGFFAGRNYIQWADDPEHFDCTPEREDYIILRNREVIGAIKEGRYYMIIPRRLVLDPHYVEDMEYLGFRCLTAATTNGVQPVSMGQDSPEFWWASSKMVVEITYMEYALNKDLWRDTREPKQEKSGVKVVAFPHCCTAGVLCNFGESAVAAGGDRKIDEEALERDILHQIQRYKNDGGAFLSATTNNEQNTANRVLTRLGFSHSKWMSKETHKETKVSLWWIHLDSLNLVTNMTRI